MVKLAVVIGLAWCTACGRVDFDPTSTALGGGPQDGAIGDGVVAVKRSCSELAFNCGPAGNASCCDSPMIPGGTFYRGYDVATDNMYPDMTNPATVSSFRLDRYEVTVGRFRQFVDAGMGTQANPPAPGAGEHPAIPGSGWDPAWNTKLAVDRTALVAALKCGGAAVQTWTDAPAGNENMPMTCISWWEAMAFCAADGGWVPTNAEWNYAASGGSQQRAYPWSNPARSITIDCTYADYGSFNWPTVGCANSMLSPVGSLSPKGDGLWGHSDLAGNVWEWALDLVTTTLPNPCTDCAALGNGGDQVIRGGSFRLDVSAVRSALLAQNGGASRYDVGVRCARAP